MKHNMKPLKLLDFDPPDKERILEISDIGHGKSGKIDMKTNSRSHGSPPNIDALTQRVENNNKQHSHSLRRWMQTI